MRLPMSPNETCGIANYREVHLAEYSGNWDPNSVMFYPGSDLRDCCEQIGSNSKYIIYSESNDRICFFI